MSTKTISITQEAYDILKAKKNSNESFSKAIVRLSSKAPLASFAGVLSKKRVDEIEKSISSGRIEHRKRQGKRLEMQKR